MRSGLLPRFKLLRFRCSAAGAAAAAHRSSEEFGFSDAVLAAADASPDCIAAIFHLIGERGEKFRLRQLAVVVGVHRIKTRSPLLRGLRRTLLSKRRGSERG